MHYKLAVFGDSYADRNGPRGQTGTGEEGWEKIYCDQQGLNITKDSFNAATSGAGNWWTYCTFDNFLKEHTADLVIFSITTIGRIPLIKERGLAFEYELYQYSPAEGMTEYVADRYTNSNRMVERNFIQYIKLWNDFNQINTKLDPDTNTFINDFPDLTRFVNIQVYKELIAKCRKYNIKALFLIPFSADITAYLSADRCNDFPIIYGLDTVSAREMRRWEEGFAGVEWSTENGGHPDRDARTNHLVQRNNQMLVAAINQALSTYTESPIIDFSEWPGLYLEHDCLDGYGTIQWDYSQLS